MAHVRATMKDGDVVVADTLRQLRQAIRKAMKKRSVERAARLAGCSAATLYRALNGANITVGMAARIVDGLGERLEIHSVADNKHTERRSSAFD